MKTFKFFFLFAIVTAVLNVPASTERDWPIPPEHGEHGLIAKANPALTDIEQLYVVIVPTGADPNKDGLDCDKIKSKIENNLKNAGISIAPTIYLGRKVEFSDIPELKVCIDTLKLNDSQKYVFHIQTSLLRPVYLTEHQRFLFKADVWKTEPVMDAASIETMPTAVTNQTLEQTQAFIHAYIAANPPDKRGSDAKTSDTVSKPVQEEQTKSVAKPATAKYKYVSSKNSKVFHIPDCTSAKRIKPENLVSYNSKDEAINAGKRPCKICKP